MLHYQITSPFSSILLIKLVFQDSRYILPPIHKCFCGSILKAQSKAHTDFALHFCFVFLIILFSVEALANCLGSILCLLLRGRPVPIPEVMHRNFSASCGWILYWKVSVFQCFYTCTIRKARKHESENFISVLLRALF